MTEFSDPSASPESYRRELTELHGESAHVHADVMAIGSNMLNLPKDLFNVSAVIDMGHSGEPDKNSDALGMYFDRTSRKVYIEALEDVPDHFYRPTRDAAGGLDARMANWVELEDGVTYTAGRNLGAEVEQDPAGNPTMLTGSRLMGRPFSNTVSAKHLTLQKQGQEVIVTDLSSTNGTGVFYAVPESSPEMDVSPQADQETVEEIGDIALPDSTRPELITTVPKTAQEAVDLQDAAEIGRQVALDRAQQAELAPLEAELNSVVDGLSAEDSHALWKYASGTLNRAEMQRLGRTQDADNEGIKISDAMKEMSPKARAVNARYYEVFRTMHNVKENYHRQALVNRLK